MHGFPNLKCLKHEIKLPASTLCPSIIIASHSTCPLSVLNDPRPALKRPFSSKIRTAFSTASTAVPLS